MRPSRTIGFMLILVILMSVCIPCKISAYDGDLLSCWYSDENSVGLWTSTPSFRMKLLAHRRAISLTSSLLLIPMPG